MAVSCEARAITEPTTSSSYTRLRIGFESPRALHISHQDLYPIRRIQEETRVPRIPP